MARPALQFSYQLNRDYPYRWFPWVAIIGGVVFTCLISAFSLATSGYQLDLIYTADPNGTEAQSFWFNQAPWAWGQHITAKCQSAQLQVGDMVFTDKQWREMKIQESFAPPPDGENDPSYSLQLTSMLVFMYSNNVLENCSVSSVEVNLSTDGPSPRDAYEADPFAVLTEKGPEMKVGIRCRLRGHSVLQMTSAQKSRAWWTAAFSAGLYNSSTEASPSDYQISQQVLAEMITFVYGMVLELDLGTIHPDTALVTGLYRFTPDPSVQDMNSTSFFRGDRRLPHNQGSTQGGQLNTNFTIPLSLDRMAKIFFASVSADLGTPTPLLNDIPVLHAWADDAVAALQNRLATFGVPIASYSHFYEAVAFWKKTAADAPVFTPNASTIYSQYQCQVPHLKSTGTLIMAVILADLVFLRALWWVFNQTTTWWLTRSDPHAMLCRGCARRVVEEGEEEERAREKCEGDGEREGEGDGESGGNSGEVVSPTTSVVPGGNGSDEHMRIGA